LKIRFRVSNDFSIFSTSVIQLFSKTIVFLLGPFDQKIRVLDFNIQRFKEKMEILKEEMQTDIIREEE